MPILGVIASGVSGHLGPAAQSYFQRAYYGANTFDTSMVLKDSSGNSYVSGVSTSLGSGGYYASVVQKFDNAGNWIWGYYWTNQGYSCSIAFAPNGNISVHSNENSRQCMYLTLSAADGSVTVSPKYFAVGVTYRSGNAYDSSQGNYWNGGNTNSGGGNYNGPGRVAGDYSTMTVYQMNGTYCDGVFYKAGNIYYNLTDTDSNGYRYGIGKLQSPNVLQWNRYFGNNYTTATSNSIYVDASDNVYIGTWQADSGTTGASGYVMKWDSSGNLLWQRNIDSGASEYVQGITVDETNGYVYVVGVTTTTPQTGFIMKFNTSGTLQWQRTLTRSNLYSVIVTYSGELQVTGDWRTMGTGGDPQMAMLRIPADGSKTGTYTIGGVSVVYAASSYTVTTSTKATGNYGGPATAYTYGGNSTSLAGYSGYNSTTQVVAI